MLSGLLRGSLFILIVGVYSLVVWKSIEAYFRDEFISYLSNEFEQNEHLKHNYDKMTVKPEKICKMTNMIQPNDENIYRKENKCTFVQYKERNPTFFDYIHMISNKINDDQTCLI